MKRIIKVCFIVGLVCLICVLCCLPFVNFNDNKVVVHADVIDTSYFYTSSNYIVTSSLYSSSVTSPQTTDFTLYNLDIQFAFGFDGSLNSDMFRIDVGILGDFNLTSQHGWYSYNNQIVYDTWTLGYIHYGSSPIHFIYHYFWDTGFDAHVFKLQIKTKLWGGTNTSIAQTEFKFTDVNGKNLLFEIFGNFNATQSFQNYYNLLSDNVFFYQDRIYYSDISLNDNQSYLQGKDDGIAIGLSEGQNSGYQEGYKKGKDIGYQLGLQEGANSQEYSVLSFVGAIVDVPIKSFTGLLNFDILGFNVLRLVTGCLTIGLVFIFVRFVFFRGK